jgi:hypothetical protein
LHGLGLVVGLLSSSQMKILNDFACKLNLNPIEFELDSIKIPNLVWIEFSKIMKSHTLKFSYHIHIGGLVKRVR